MITFIAPNCYSRGYRIPAIAPHFSLPMHLTTPTSCPSAFSCSPYVYPMT